MYPFLLRHHISVIVSKEINWLRTKERIEQRVAMKVFKYWKGTSPFYVYQVFVPSRSACKTRSHMALEIPLRKSKLGQKTILFSGQSIWNKLNNDLKILNTGTI